jgi:AraC-like DNA-binding protein
LPDVLKKRDIPRGVLDPQSGAGRYQERLERPSWDVVEYVKHYWSARWDLGDGDSHMVSTLPHPTVNLVVEPFHPSIHGVLTGRFTYQLTGAGRIFGITFRPAGFRPFLGTSVASLTNSSTSVGAVFGAGGAELVAQLLQLEDVAEMVALSDRFVRERRPPVDPKVQMLNGIVEQIELDRSLTRVEAVVERTGMSKRTLQRLFREYVGVSPKWVIQRYRLHEAADQLDSGSEIDLATLAQELGYADQAHLARDFKALVGRSPREYARGNARR